MGKPAWYEWAENEIGEKEVPGRGSNPRIMAYREMAGIHLGGDDSDVPWCKIFVNAALKQTGFPVNPNAMALSITADDNFSELDGPCEGCIVVFWRGHPKSGTGHIGFYAGENESGSRILVLGGNEGDQVKKAFFPKNSAHFGLVGYYWPNTAPEPDSGAFVVDDDGEPVGSAV